MNCLYCGKELPRQHKKYCSKECYSKSGGPISQIDVEVKRICQVCGKEYIGDGDKYCSQSCYHKSPTKGRPPIKPRKLCIVCNNPIPVNNQKFCSHECYCKYWKGKQKPNTWKREIKTCPVCGKEFECGGRGEHRKGVTYCSQTCAHESKIKDSGYRAWYRLSKEVRVRDGKCMLCGNTERRLQPHHIVPRDYKKWSEFNGMDKPEDLICFCAGCHQSVEALTKAGYRNNPDFNPFELINMVRIKEK